MDPDAALANIVAKNKNPAPAPAPESAPKVRLTRKERSTILLDVAKEEKKKVSDAAELKARRVAPNPAKVLAEKKRLDEAELKEKITHRRRIGKLLVLVETHGIHERESLDLKPPTTDLTLAQLRARHAEISDALSRIDVTKQINELVFGVTAEAEKFCHNDDDLPNMDGLTQAISKDPTLKLSIEEFAIEHDDAMSSRPSFRILFSIGRTAMMVFKANQVNTLGGKRVAPDIQRVVESFA